MSRHDDQVRRLFEWVKNEESNGVECAAVANMIGNRAVARHGLTATINISGKRVEVTFAGTDLIIRHDGTEWQLHAPRGGGGQENG